MDTQRWLDEYLARIEGIRWLRPDAELDALAESAQQWVSDRVEEHAVALSRFALEGDALTPAWSPLRLIDQSRDLSGHTPSAAQAAGFAQPALEWLARLDDARVFSLRRAREVLGPAQRVAVAEAVWASLRGPVRRAQKRAFQSRSDRSRWDGGGRVRGPEDFVVGAPGGAALVHHALWVLSDPEGVSSPWEPLIALWERGACTLAALDGTLLVYVPLRLDGALQATDGIDASEVSFRGGLSSTSVMRRPTTVVSEVTRAALKGFNQHGLGPLPEMCMPLNVSTEIMATNWPGPPDPYVYPPPASVDAAALYVAEQEHFALIAKSVATGASFPPSFSTRVAAWLTRRA